MKKLLTIQLVTLVAVGSAALAADIALPVAGGNNHLPVSVIIDSGDDIVVKEYDATREQTDTFDFEDGEGGQGWSHFGNGVQEAWWHIDTEHAWDGNSWWSGDEEVGGYLSDSYMVLDSPSFDLTTVSGSVDLTFKLLYGYEIPGGEPDGYDGWDAGNIRVSTDGGSSWTTISGAPAYGMTSSYAFGYQFGEGQGVPGWGRDSHGWLDATFNLDAYIGQSDVMVRWASCADPAYDFIDDDGLIGMVIDDVLIQDGRTTFVSFNADDASVPSDPISGFVTGSDYWEYSDVDAHSGTYSYNCDDINEINPYLASGEIELLADHNIYLSLWVKCNMPDSDGDDDGFLEDYYHVHISTDGGTTWEDLCYDYYQDYNGEVWGLMDNNNIFNGTLELTSYAGQMARVAISLQTDDNADGGDGTGLWIDDVVIYQTQAAADDCGISKIWMDSPRTENLERNVGVQLDNFGLNPQFSIPAFYMVEKEGVPVFGPVPLSPFEDVAPQEYARYYANLAPFTPVDGPGIYTFTAWTQLAGDEFQGNDTLSYDFNVYEDGLGLFMYDGDTSTAWTLDVLDWALIRVDQDLGFPFNAKWFTALMYNMEIGDDVNVVIYDAGVDDEHLGAVIADRTYQVGTIYPDYDHFFIGDVPELQDRTTDFWIGVHGPCGIVGFSEDYWISHSYLGYDDAAREFVIEPWGGDLSFLVEGCWGSGCFPYAMVELEITYSGGNASLDWNDVDGADSYSIYRSEVPYFSPAVENLLIDGVIPSEYVHTGVFGEAFYRVVAVQN
jgi:hypothetical protein